MPNYNPQQYDRDFLHSIICVANIQVVVDTDSDPEADLREICSNVNIRCKFEKHFRLMMADTTRTYVEKAAELLGEDLVDDDKAKRIFEWVWECAIGREWEDRSDPAEK